ncbi:hypothetical protein [Streptomyces albipurpureus]|uniref:Secreted protein n=1 Tax=Streptomyces albipurpureus TaxID=2897419 RepID=A0ABT0UKN0_9ACTN|nr:hypothetical protein [Streptomyces sp. CWNU-1]MCM2388921.1 hypothetical protein [Streptomyces sp. CWNU-1]
MKQNIRDTLLICAAPVVVLLVGLLTVSSSQTTTDASGRTTTTSGLADAPAMIVYAVALASLAVSVLVLRRIRRSHER